MGIIITNMPLSPDQARRFIPRTPVYTEPLVTKTGADIAGDAAGATAAIITASVFPEIVLFASGSGKHSGRETSPPPERRKLKEDGTLTTLKVLIIATATTLALTGSVAVVREVGNTLWPIPHCATPIHPQGQDHC